MSCVLALLPWYVACEVPPSNTFCLPQLKACGYTKRVKTSCTEDASRQERRQDYEKTHHSLPVKGLTANYHRSHCSAKARVTL
jgi:hypothetical protein